MDERLAGNSQRREISFAAQRGQNRNGRDCENENSPHERRLSQSVRAKEITKCGGRLLFGDRLDRLDGDGEAGFLTVGRGAGDRTNFNGFVVSGVDTGEELDGFFGFAGDDGGAEFFFGAAQLGFDAAVLEVFALAVTHPAFG